MREPSFWHRPSSWTSHLLRPFGALYGAVAAQRLRRKGFDAGIPVLCVGNYHVGGAGKTPTVLALAAELKSSGAPQLSYVGVIDVTFIPYGVGRQPPLPNGLGGLKPYNPPDKNAISNWEFTNAANLMPYIHPNVGGGSLPDQSMKSWVIEIVAKTVSDTELARRLRLGTPAVLARLRDGKLVLDVRTIFAYQEAPLIEAVRKAVRGDQ